MIKTKIIIMAVIGLSLTMCDCGPVVLIPTNLHLQGTVTDAQNGAPIAGAIVAIVGVGESRGGVQYTNAEGYYSITYSIIFVGESLEVQQVGYKTQNHAIENTSSLQTINISLERATN